MNLNYNKANWKLYQEILTNSSSQIDTNAPLNELNRNICTVILKAAEKSIPTHRLTQNKTPLPKYIINKIKKRRYYHREFIKYRNINDKKCYNRLTGQIRKDIKNYRNSKWQKLINDVNYGNKNSRTYWSSIQRIIGTKKAKTQIKSIKKEDEILTNEQEIADYFGEHFEKTFSDSSDKNFDNDWLNKVNNDILSSDIQLDYNNLITITTVEIDKVIKGLKVNKSSGYDQISNKMLKNLPKEFIQILKILFEKSLNTGTLPDDWKHAVITLVPKPNKDHQTLNGYRPVSLLSCLSKILEKIVNAKLMNFMETNNQIIQEQCGFRKNRSTIDNLTRFSLDIYNTNKHNKQNILIACILDIEKCFDKIWINGLKYKISKLDIHLNLKAWLFNFLTGRSFKVKINKIYSETFEITAGVPQGAILSPTLYLLFTSDMPYATLEDNGTKVSAYADDFNMWNIAPMKYSYLARKAFQKSLDVMIDWADRWRLKLNPHKCETILIKNGLGAGKIYYKNLYIHDEEISKVENIKFLGLDFTNNFRFDQFIERKLKGCSHIINGIKIAKGKKVKREITIQIYNTFIKSKLTYACPSWTPFLNKTDLKRLETFHLKCLKIALNYPPWMETTRVLKESISTKLYETFKQQTLNYIQKSRGLQNGLNNDSLDNLKEILFEQESRYF